MQEPSIFYNFRIRENTGLIQSLQQKIVWVSAARLAAFLLIGFFVYRLTGNQGAFNATALVILVLCFFVLLRISFNLSSEKKLAAQLLFINRNELNVLANGLNEFPEGEDNIGHSIYSQDLDIFGLRSLYHLLNRTTTTHGAERLAGLLNEPFTDIASITLHQEAIRQLNSLAPIRQMITARGLLRNTQEGTIGEIAQWIQGSSLLAGKTWLNITRFVLPVFNISAFLYYLDAGNPVPVGIGVIISWLVIGYYGKYIHKQHSLIGRKQSILDQYASILKEFDKANPGSSGLLQELLKISLNGEKEIRNLSRLTNFLDQRLNLLVNFFLNSLFLYDIHCMVSLEHWKLRNRDRFAQWMETVGEIEMLNSMSSFSFNHPDYCFPEPQLGKPMIMGKGMAHPLIPAAEAVTNDLEAGENDKLLLVTGSNMSGKSTFLRTVGINLLLAQCGGPVCARSFEFAPMKILSSIRISDSLQEHTSYFMAELKRLKEIINALETGKPALVLIDEVLRGTNSNDKTQGSIFFIKKLVRYQCLSLFATHDLTLSELETTFPGEVSNYCFESTIVNGELLFDYKLRKGVATNKNATFLMQKMEII